MIKTKIFLFFFAVALGLTSCSKSKKEVYQKSPVDRMVSEMINEPNFSIILADMDYIESQDLYQHKYQVVIPRDSSFTVAETQKDSTTVSLQTELTDWQQVSPQFFDQNIDNLGMNLASKQNGVLDKIPSPAGYDQYVGNDKYGYWDNRGGGQSFWVFYGQYRLMSDLFFPGHRYSYSSWNDYDRNYRGRSSYYGSGDNKYGTNSDKNSKSNWKNKPNSFKQNVRSKVSRSSRSSSAKSSGRTSRSGSRYSGSSSRSRGGGAGK